MDQTPKRKTAVKPALKYDISTLLQMNKSYYSLVIAVSKRAREITDLADREKRVMDVKAVKVAIDELQDGNHTIIEILPDESYGTI